MSSIEKLTVVQLREKLKQKGIKGYSKLRKDELIKLLEGNTENKENEMNKESEINEVNKESEISEVNKKSEINKINKQNEVNKESEMNKESEINEVNKKSEISEVNIEKLEINLKTDNKETIDIKKLLDVTNDFNISIVSMKVGYLRTIGYKSLAHWMNDPNNMYLGRSGRLWITLEGTKNIFYYPGSIFGNIFKLSDCVDVNDCLVKYKNYILNNKELYDSLDKLKGKNIGCFCDIEKPCHIKVLLMLLKEKEKLKEKEI
jgi:hypothetical protein